MEAIIISKNDFNLLIENFFLLEKKIDNISNVKSSKPWLTIDETCAYLSVSKRTLQSYRDNGILPFSQYTNKVYFRLEDLDKFLFSNYNKLETAGKSTNFHSKKLKR